VNVNCAFCGKPVDPTNPHVWQRVVGWQRIAGVRASGKHGGSDIRLRETRQEWAHPGCVTLTKDGIAVGQGALL
jgi:hypothetical protein